MPATYPAATKVFIAHKNNIEDIDAAHVNALQDEVSATQTVVGTFPQIDTGLNYQWNDYGTVRGRMEQISRGYHIPVCRVSRLITKQPIPHNTGTAIVWDTSSQVDPYNMFASGTDVVLSKTGWWSITTDMNYDGHNDYNLRSIILLWANAFGSNPNSSASWGPLTGYNTNNDPTSFAAFGFPTSYGLAYQGKLPKGAIIRVLLQQQSGITLNSKGGLSVACLREI